VWISNYGDGTVQEISLATNAVTRTANIGAHPTSLAYDATNNALWVGGSGYIAKLDLASFSVTGSIPTGGQVLSSSCPAGVFR
jgi:DNA-binding beta-propeller fold protein YncE